VINKIGQETTTFIRGLKIQHVAHNLLLV